MKLKSLLLSGILSLYSVLVFSTNYTWTNGGGDNAWETPSNWSTNNGTTPGSGDNVTFDGATSNANCVISSSISIGTLTLNASYTGNVSWSDDFSVTTGTIIISNGTLDMSSIAASPVVIGAITINGASASFISNPGATFSSGTLNMSAGTADFSSAASVTLTGLTISGGTFSAGSSITLNGNMSLSGSGVFNNNNGLIILASAAATRTITGSFVFHNLTFTFNSNSINQTRAINIANDIEIQGTLKFTFTGSGANKTLNLGSSGFNYKLTDDGTSGAVVTTSNSSGTVAAINMNANVNYASSIAQQTMYFDNTNHLTYSNVYINNTSGNGVVLGGAVTTSNITGDLKVQSGILDNSSSGFAIAGNGGKTFEVDNGATLKLQGSSAFPSGFGTVTLQSSSTVNYAGSGSQTIAAASYGNLTSSSTGGRTLVNGGTIHVAGTFTQGTNSYTVTNNTFDFNGSSAQSIPLSASPSYNDITINNTGASFVAAVTSSNVTGNITLQSGTLSTAFAITGNAGKTFQVNDGTTFTTTFLGASAFPTGFSTITLQTTSSTVVYGGAGAQTINATPTYTNLTISGSGTKTISALLDVDGTLTISAGTLDLSGFQTNLAGNLVNNGTLTSASNTVLFNGTTVVSGTGTNTFNNFSLNATNSLTLGSTATNIAGTVTLGAGSTFNMGTGTITMTAAAATWTDNGATIAPSTSTTVFNGVGSHTITSTQFGALTFNGTIVAPSSLKVAGDFTNNGTFTHNNGTVDFNGAAASTQNISWSVAKNVFYNMNASTSNHTVKLTSSADLVNILNVTANATFNTNAQTFTLLSTTDLNGNTGTGGGTAQIGDLTSGTFTGNVVYQRYISGFTEWRTLGCPIKAQTISNWISGSSSTFYTSGFTGSTDPASSFVSVYTYNAGTQNYDTPTAAGTGDPISADNGTVAGKGFLVYTGNTSPGTVMSPALTLNLTGNIISGSLNPAVSTAWNLMANPYPAALSWSSFYTTNMANISSYYYIYDSQAGGFTGWDNSGGAISGSRTTGNIGSGQAFFINAASNTSVTFNEAHKAGTADGNFMKINGAAVKKMNLQISSSTATPFQNGTLIVFSPLSSDNFNVLEDGPAMDPFNAQAPVINSYSADGQRLMLNKMGDLTKNYDIPVQVKVGVAGVYTISTPDLSNIPGSCVILEDKLTGTQTDLRSTNSYDFTISDTTNAPRFVLHFTTNVNVTTQAIDASCVGNADGMLIASPVGNGPWNYTWKNQKDSVLKTTLNSSIPDTLLHLSQGTYKVVVSTSAASCSNNYTETLQVNQPAPTVAMFTASLTTVSVGVPVNFTNGSTSATSYTWNFGDATTDNTQNPSHTYNVAGTYTVQLKASNGTCAADSTTDVIHVIPPLGINNISNTNGIDVSSTNEKVFVQINYDHATSGTIELYDALGKNIYKENFEGSHLNEQLDLPSIDNGIYFVRVSTSDKNVFTKRVFIKN